MVISPPAEKQTLCLRRESVFRFSDGKVSVHENRDFPSVLGGAYDGEILRAYHEVHMGDGIVEAASLQLLLIHVAAALDAGVSLAEGDVAGGVFVEQGVIEQQLLIGDGAVVGHQRHLAEVSGALVHGDGP